MEYGITRTQQYGENSSSFSDQVALLPKLKTKAKDDAKSVSLFWERDQSKLCTSTSTSSIFLALSQRTQYVECLDKQASYVV